jgi:hypothetical protein
MTAKAPWIASYIRRWPGEKDKNSRALRKRFRYNAAL